MTYDTEQEKNHDDESSNAAGDRAPEDASGCCDASVLGLLGYVPRGVKSNEDAGRGKVRQAPVPTCRSSSSIIGCHEGVVGGSESVDAVARRDRQPNHIQDKVKEDERGRQIEDPFEITG